MTPISFSAAILLCFARTAATQAVTREELDTLRAAMQERVTSLEGVVSTLGGRVHILEAENKQLRKQSAAAPQQARAVNVEARGAAARRLQVGGAPECCRWTPDDTCGTVADERLYRCSRLHEFLERSSVVHEFANVAQCLGDDEASWAFRFNGVTGDVSLDGTPGIAYRRQLQAQTQSTFPTPFKVTHAADCQSVAPVLNVRLNTVMEGSLTVGGVDVGAALASAGGENGPCGVAAAFASCTASSEFDAQYGCANVANSDGEWATKAEATGSWIQMNFASETTINTMKYTNRDFIESNKKVQLEFSDGSTVVVDDITQSEVVSTHRFPSVSTSSVKISVIEHYTWVNNGAKEITFSSECVMKLAE